MSLMHLIYLSSGVVQYDDAELDKILESSVRHNLEQNITGLLLYADGNFIQVIEGDEEAVEETFSRIEKDVRHHHLYVVERKKILTRTFDAWAMSFRRLQEIDMVGHPEYLKFFGESFDQVRFLRKDGIAFKLLSFFAETSQMKMF